MENKSALNCVKLPSARPFSQRRIANYAFPTTVLTNMNVAPIKSLDLTPTSDVSAPLSSSFISKTVAAAPFPGKQNRRLSRKRIRSGGKQEASNDNPSNNESSSNRKTTKSLLKKKHHHTRRQQTTTTHASNSTVLYHKHGQQSKQKHRAKVAIPIAPSRLLSSASPSRLQQHKSCNSVSAAAGVPESDTASASQQALPSLSSSSSSSSSSSKGESIVVASSDKAMKLTKMKLLLRYGKFVQLSVPAAFLPAHRTDENEPSCQQQSTSITHQANTPINAQPHSSKLRTDTKLVSSMRHSAEPKSAKNDTNHLSSSVGSRCTPMLNSLFVPKDTALRVTSPIFQLHMNLLDSVVAVAANNSTTLSHRREAAIHKTDVRTTDTNYTTKAVTMPAMVVSRSSVAAMVKDHPSIACPLALQQQTDIKDSCQYDKASQRCESSKGTWSTIDGTLDKWGQNKKGGDNKQFSASSSAEQYAQPLYLRSPEPTMLPIPERLLWRRRRRTATTTTTTTQDRRRLCPPIGC